MCCNRRFRSDPEDDTHMPLLPLPYTKIPDGLGFPRVAPVSQSPTASWTVSLVDRSLVRWYTRSHSPQRVGCWFVSTIADSLACLIVRHRVLASVSANCDAFRFLSSCPPSVSFGYRSEVHSPATSVVLTSYSWSSDAYNSLIESLGLIGRAKAKRESKRELPRPLLFIVSVRI